MLETECTGLMLKEKEISKENRLLAKQFRQKKEGHQKRQQFLQKVSTYTASSFVLGLFLPVS